MFFSGNKIAFGYSIVLVYTEHVVTQKLTKRYPSIEPLKITSTRWPPGDTTLCYVLMGIAIVRILLVASDRTLKPA